MSLIQLWLSRWFIASSLFSIRASFCFVTSSVSRAKHTALSSITVSHPSKTMEGCKTTLKLLFSFVLPSFKCCHPKWKFWLWKPLHNRRFSCPSYKTFLLLIRREHSYPLSSVLSWGFSFCLGTMKTVALKRLTYDDFMKKVVKWKCKTINISMSVLTHLQFMYP